MTSYYIKTLRDGDRERPIIAKTGDNTGVPRTRDTQGIYSKLLSTDQAALFGNPDEAYGNDWLYNYLRLTSQRVDNPNRVIIGEPVVKLAKQAIIDYLAEMGIDITPEFLYESAGGATFSLTTQEGLEVDFNKLPAPTFLELTEQIADARMGGDNEEEVVKLIRRRDEGFLYSSLDPSWDWEWFCIGFDLPNLKQSSTTGTTSDDGELCEVEVTLSKMSFCICLKLPVGKIKSLAKRFIKEKPPPPGLFGPLVKGVGDAVSRGAMIVKPDWEVLNILFDKFPDFWKDLLGKVYNRAVHSELGQIMGEGATDWLPEQYEPDIEAYKPKVGASGKDRCDVICKKTGKADCSSDPVISLSMDRTFWIPCGKVSKAIPQIASD